MKEKLRITSYIKTTELEMRTKKGGGWSVLTDQFYMTSVEEFTSNPAFKGQSIIKIEFTTTNKTWDMEYDMEDLPVLVRDESKGITDYHVEQSKEAHNLNKRKRMAVGEFIARHWQLENFTGIQNGHNPSGYILGKVELLTQKAKGHHLTDRKKAQVFNLIDKMGWQEQYDLALYYTPWNAKKRRSEIVQGLIGLKGIGTPESNKGGIMWQAPAVGAPLYCDDFLQSYHNNPTVVMKIYINKAHSLGIITTGPDGLYLNGTTFVGKDADSAVVYFSADIQSYNNVIQPEVNRQLELPDDDMADAPVEFQLKSKHEKEQVRERDKQGWKDHYRDLVVRLEATGKKMPEKIATSELELLVEAAEKEYAENKKKKQMPTSALEQNIDPSTTTDITELRQIMKDRDIKGWATTINPETARRKIQESMDEQQKREITPTT